MHPLAVRVEAAFHYVIDRVRSCIAHRFTARLRYLSIENAEQESSNFGPAFEAGRGLDECLKVAWVTSSARCGVSPDALAARSICGR